MQIFIEKLGEKWYEKLEDYLLSNSFRELGSKIVNEYKIKTIYPEYNDIFKAYKLTNYDDVKVVILGQDPYPNGEADGLAFSVKEDDYIIKIPPSLKAIFDEIEKDVYGGFRVEQDWNLERWAKQGVFLLNTILTVEKGKPKSHALYGWEEFTKVTIEKLNESDNPICFMLWGKDAKSYKKFITNEHHLVLQSGHPATKYYETDYWSGNRHFSKCNKFLIQNNRGSIEW
jgi:uracil-DNA glycosylase